MSGHGAGTVEAWQVVVLATTVLLTVLGVYGALIKRNYNVVRRIDQRLFGTDGDDTDDGFIADTEREFESLNERISEHSRQTHDQLQRVDRKMDVVVRAVAREHETLEPDELLDDRPADAQPPENSSLFYRGAHLTDEDDRDPSHHMGDDD